MKSVDFEQANVTIGAGDNPNTQPLRIALCNNAQMPNYKFGFLVSKWEMDDSERYQFGEKLTEFLEPELVSQVLKALPPIFLSSMHSMSPVMILQGPESAIFNDSFLQPDQEAADRVNKKRVLDN